MKFLNNKVSELLVAYIRLQFKMQQQKAAKCWWCRQILGLQIFVTCGSYENLEDFIDVHKDFMFFSGISYALSFCLNIQP